MKNLKTWCIENEQYDLLELYENAENEDESNEIAFSSSKKVKWKCTNCNIEWVQELKKVARKERRKGCPYCSHHRASYFYNLITEYPELKEEWDYEKNNKQPTEYLPQSRKKIFWKCSKGHTWEETIERRVKSLKVNLKEKREICPYCNHHRISPEYNLVTEYPEIAKQWNYLKNGMLTPLEVSPKSGTVVWWKCKNKHEWMAVIHSRTSTQSNCPYCYHIKKIKDNLLVKKRPDICKFWNYEKNKGKSIENYSCGSSEIVWWKCEKKHEWQTKIYYMTRIKGKDKCPYCAGRKK